ncbi:MAG: threonine/serine exporter family protein [Anaeromassilibacillus sp.]
MPWSPFPFTLFYGGPLSDAFCSLFCGAGVKLVNHFMGRFQANAFFTNIVASCVAATIAMLAVQMGFGANLDKIIIGALMNLVPASSSPALCATSWAAI